MVVPVFMMSCHVSLKPNIGPEAAHRSNVTTAIVNAGGRPTAREAHLANRVKTEGFFVTLILMLDRNIEESDLPPGLRVSRVRRTRRSSQARLFDPNFRETAAENVFTHETPAPYDSSV